LTGKLRIARTPSNGESGDQTTNLPIQDHVKCADFSALNLGGSAAL
jgi:hypothetical protein